MKITNLTKKVALALLSGIILLGCSKDENYPQKEFTPEEAKKTIETTMDSFYRCLQNMNDGGFSNFFYNSFFVIAKDSRETKTETYTDWEGKTHSYSYTIGQVSTWFDLLGDKFAEKYELNKDNGFNYNGLKGIYTWNATKEDWDYNPVSSNITLQFPANKEAKTNNAEWVITDYTDVETSFENEKIRLPQKGTMIARVDGTKVFEVVIKDVTYDVKTNFSMPLTASISIFTNPFTTNIEWNSKTREIFILNFVMSSPQGCTTAINGEFRLKHSDYGNITNPVKDFEKISLTITQNDLQIKTNIDVVSIDKLNKDLDKITIAEANTYIKTEVFAEGSKIADLVLNEDAKGKLSPDLIFSDGSKEKAEKYVANFAEKFEQIFKKFFDAKK